MGTANYYVYALMDPRTIPAKPFYIGKGHGVRKFQHLSEPDQSEKWSRIESIRSDGHEPTVVELVTDLTESQALVLEAQLIAAFGTTSSGGTLTNKVLPTGSRKLRRPLLVMPWGVEERAQAGLHLLTESVYDFVSANPTGVTNADVANALGLRSHYLGASKDYLSYSVLGLLLNANRLQRQGSKYLGASMASK